MAKNISQKKIFLWLAIVLYIAIFFYLCFYKYQNFLYNLEDLSIFNNVLWNTAHGKWFWFSSHGGFSYLGDHLELGLLLLLPIYYFFQSPLTLLFLQTALFALSAWPVYLICRHYYCRDALQCVSTIPYVSTTFLPLIFAIIFLLNPFLHNINLEEFHVAPLLLFFFLWTFYFYLRKKYRMFILFFILTLLIREDAALTLGALATLAAWDNRHYLWREKKWWLYPLVMAVIWFFLAQKIITFFNPDDQFRYFLLYQTLLLDSFSQILSHLLALKNLWLLIGLLLPFLFLPLYRPKYLWLALPTLGQLFLSDSGGSQVILNTHYQIFILAALFLSLAQSLVGFSQTKRQYLPLLLGLLLFSQFYASYFLGPLKILQRTDPPVLTNLEDGQQNQEMLNIIPSSAAISAPYRFLPILSSREKIYVNKLTFLGKRHLSSADFQLPAETEYLLIDTADLIEYYLHFQNRDNYSRLYWNGAERMRQTIARLNFQPIALTDSLILLKKDAAASPLPYQIIETLPAGLRGEKKDWGEAEFLGWSKSTTSLEHYITSSLDHYITSSLDHYITSSLEHLNTQTLKHLNNATLFFRATQQIGDDYFFEITALNANQKTIWQKIYPPAYGLLPTHDWPTDKYVTIAQILPADPVIASYRISLIKIKGDIELGPLNDTRLVVDKKEKIGEFNLPH